MLNVDTHPKISLVIPTYNRINSLLRTLDCLIRQTYPAECFEVIIVDDGSTDNTYTILNMQFPFPLRYFYQENKGASKARNYGASMSQAEILVFMDDDVTISEKTLEALAVSCDQTSRAIVNPILIQRSSNNSSIYTAIISSSLNDLKVSEHGEISNLIRCNTQLLACKRTDFIELGMLQELSKENVWGYWADTDFGYRAYLHGFKLLQSDLASGEHWDYSLNDWSTACQRWYRACRIAVWLFAIHPALKGAIPMLVDKTPISWKKDSPMLIARKLARFFLSARPLLRAVEKFVRFLEYNFPIPSVLHRLYFWLQGSYMFHGYREGLRDYKQALAKG